MNGQPVYIYMAQVLVCERRNHGEDEYVSFACIYGRTPEHATERASTYGKRCATTHHRGETQPHQQKAPIAMPSTPDLIESLCAPAWWEKES